MSNIVGGGVIQNNSVEVYSGNTGAGNTTPSTVPAVQTQNNLWVNSATNQVTHWWNPATLAWVPLSVSDNEIISGTVTPVAAPADPSERKLFVNTTSNQITHFWSGVAWVPIVGTFPIILRCDGTNALASDRFLTANAGSGVASPLLGGVAATSRQLWSFANDGSGCPAEVTAPAAPCTDATIPAAPSVMLGALADGTVGWVRPKATERVPVRTVTANYIVDLLVDNTIFADSTAGTITVTVPTPTAGNLCQANRLTIKRVLPNGSFATQTANNSTTVIITSPSGFDNAPGNDITLSLSTAYGAITGESVTIIFDGTTWRII
jgi:hypothetical protein